MSVQAGVYTYPRDIFNTQPSIQVAGISPPVFETCGIIPKPEPQPVFQAHWDPVERSEDVVDVSEAVTISSPPTLHTSEVIKIPIPPEVLEMLEPRFDGPFPVLHAFTLSLNSVAPHTVVQSTRSHELRPMTRMLARIGKSLLIYLYK